MESWFDRQRVDAVVPEMSHLLGGSTTGTSPRPFGVSSITVSLILEFADASSAPDASKHNPASKAARLAILENNPDLPTATQRWQHNVHRTGLKAK